MQRRDHAQPPNFWEFRNALTQKYADGVRH